MRQTQVLARIEAAVNAAGTAKTLALAWGVSQPYLSDVRAGKRAPGPKILRHLGLTAEMNYSRSQDATT